MHVLCTGYVRIIIAFMHLECTCVYTYVHYVIGTHATAWRCEWGLRCCMWVAMNISVWLAGMRCCNIHIRTCFCACSCSSAVCSAELHHHWGWCGQHHFGNKHYWLHVWLHCHSPEHGWVSYRWVLHCSSYCTHFTAHLVIASLFSAFHLPAGYDYEAGPYTVTFTAGQLYATLMVSTLDDNTTELTEYFSVAITSTDQPGAAEIGPYDTAFLTIEDNDPGIAVTFCLCSCIIWIVTAHFLKT